MKIPQINQHPAILQAIRVGLLLLGASGGLSSVKAASTPTSEREAREAFQNFPKAYWYAYDAWIKTVNDTWNSGDPLAASAKQKIKDFKFKNADGNPTLEFQVTDEEDPDTNNSFVFTLIGGKWTATQGWDNSGNSRTDLFKQRFRAPSQQPFVDAEVQKMIRKEGIYAPGKRKPAVVPPAYATLVGENLSGAGFHFSWRGKRFIVSTLHQFQNKTPATFSSTDRKSVVEILKRKHDQTDIQVLTYKGGWLDQKSPLVYDNPQPQPEVADPVFVLNDNRWMAAQILTTRQGQIRLEMEKPFPAMGSSGSPIISGMTGKVIAVLIGADSPSAAKIVECEPLRLPLSILEEVDIDLIPAKIFGIPSKEKPSLDTIRTVQNEVLHPGVFSASLGMSGEELLKARPDSDKEPSSAYEGKSTYEVFPKTYLFSSVEYLQKAKHIFGLELRSIRPATPEELASLTRFVLCYFGKPSVLYERETNPKQAGAEAMIFYWASEEYSASLYFGTLTGLNAVLNIRAGIRQPQEMFNMNQARPLPLNQETLGDEVSRWANSIRNSKAIR